MKDHKQVKMADKLNLSPNQDNDVIRSGQLTPTHHRVQAKLKINTPGDKHEQEAVRMADRIAGPSSDNGRVSHSSFNANSNEVNDTSLVGDVLNSPGQPLPNNIRKNMEVGFGRDFSRVRIHDDNKAANSAQAINAAAYSHGNNIVFNKGSKHNTAEGAHLLAHELSHVVQQAGMGGHNFIQRQPLSPDLADQVSSVDLRENASSLLAGSLGSAEISGFKTGNDELPAGGLDTLRHSAKQIIFFIEKFSLSTVNVKGHTDRVGTDENNATLGQRRADAVKDFLVREGVPEGIISTESKGESSPAVPTKDNVGEPRNRRVEVRFSVRKSPVSFGMDIKMRAPDKQIQITPPPERPKLNLNLTELPKPIGPVRNPDETSLWKKMEEGQRFIEEYGKKHPHKAQSVSDLVIDGVMDKAIKPLLNNIPISDKLRNKAEELIRKGIESGIEKAVDAAVDALPDGADKQAIKKAAKAALKQK